MTTSLHQLREHGQSPWIDYISRSFVRGGDLEALVDQGVVGVTSNPTIFDHAIKSLRFFIVNLAYSATAAEPFS